MPTAAPPMVITKNTMKAMKIMTFPYRRPGFIGFDPVRMITSDLDVHNLLNHGVTDQLQENCSAQHPVADLVGEKETDIVRIDPKHENRDADRNQGEGRAGHFAVSADRPDAATELEALADYVGQLVENFCEVSTSALLQQNGRYEKVDVQRRDAG